MGLLMCVGGLLFVASDNIWLLLLAAQKRFVRFVIFAAWTKRFGIRHLLRWAGAIPIDGFAGPRAIVKSLRGASDALKKGELVVFVAGQPVGRPGTTNLMKLHRLGVA